MNVSSVAFKDLRLLLKDRGQTVMLFLLPMLFILAFSLASLVGEPEEEADETADSEGEEKPKED